MFKQLLTSTSVRLIVLLLFFGVCAGLTWSNSAHSDCYSHIEKLTNGSFDAEDRVAKDLCPTVTEAPVALHYLPFESTLVSRHQHPLQVDHSFVPTVGRAPPILS